VRTGTGIKMKWLSRRLAPLVLGVLCLMLPCRTAFAIDPDKEITQYVHSTWRVEDGLPQNAITKILETSDGYLWLGTQAGLARFDGVSFTIFDHTNTPSLKGDYISDLAEDSRGTLWIGTTNGGVTSLRDGVFKHLDPVEPRGSSVFAAGPDGSLWVGGYGGLQHFKKGALIKTYTSADGLSGNPVKSVVVDRNGAVWIGSPGGLNRLVNGKMQTYTVRDGLPNTDVSALCLDADGTLRVKTQNSEFVQWTNGRFVPWHIPGITGSNVRDVIRDRDGEYWLASNTEGLLRVNGTRVSQFTTKDGLASDAAAHVYQDRDGNLWVGTLGGLERFRDGSFTTFLKPGGISDNRVDSVIEDGFGDIWAAGPDGLHQLHGTDIRVYKPSDKTLEPWALGIDHASHLLVGTSQTLMQMDHGSLVPSPAACAGIPPYLMSAILADSAHQIWVTTLGGGLAHCINGKLSENFTAATGLLSNKLYALARGANDTIWIGGDNGLNSIQGSQIKSYQKFTGLHNAWILSLYVDNKNILWIGTFGQGLFRLEDGRFTQYSIQQGLQNDTVYGIVEDASDNLWIGSDKGVSRITREDLDAVATGFRQVITPVAFGKADGMKSISLSGGTQPSAWRAHDGRLWFPTERGVIVVDPEKLTLDNRAPQSRVEQMTADEVHIDLESPVRLQPGTRRLEIRYTAPNLSTPERTEFRYRLDGYDEQWIPGKTQRIALYTNLSPGHYTFHVVARVANGSWSTHEGTLVFDLSPQFYQSIWFRFLCVFAFIALLWGAYRLRVGFLHARAAVLEERQRIAREIHDSLAQSLSGILFQTEAALISMTRAPEMTTTHMKSARDLAKTSLDDARYSVWNLSPPVLDQKNLSESVTSMARQLAQGRVEELDINSTGNAWALQPEAKHHVVMIVQEAISNAIQHGEARTISITLVFEDKALSVTVSDDGRGFAQAIGEQTPARGYGLRNMQHRSNSLGAKLAVTSQVGSGTRVMLCIPRLGRAANLWRRLRGIPTTRTEN